MQQQTESKSIAEFTSTDFTMILNPTYRKVHKAVARVP